MKASYQRSELDGFFSQEILERSHAEAPFVSHRSRPAVMISAYTRLTMGRPHRHDCGDYFEALTFAVAGYRTASAALKISAKERFLTRRQFTTPPRQ
jgi:hypothetical protein